MNTVITINLNGRAFQIEHEGHVLLSEYLMKAEAKLADNPDAKEITSDLEQAIADKAQRFVNAYKNVLFTQEIKTILDEMGPVNSSEPVSEENTAESALHDEKNDEEDSSPQKSTRGESVKRLYLIREGAYITGVCTGLAAYFNADVTLIRLLFVGLTILTHGAWILVYVVMAIVVPYANTSEEKAAAHGLPFNAQELIARAKEKYSSFDKQYWKDQKREWKRWAKKNANEIQGSFQRNAPNLLKAGMGFAGAIIAILIAIFAVGWIVAVVSLLTTGAIFGFIFVGMPLWIAILVVTFLYHLATLPLRALRNQSYPHHQKIVNEYGAHGGWSDTWDALMWFVFFTLLGWVLWTFVPYTHELWNSFATWARSIMNA